MVTIVQTPIRCTVAVRLKVAPMKPDSITLVALLFSEIPTSATALSRCEMDGKSVNPSNGFETAKLTGMLR